MDKKKSCLVVVALLLLLGGCSQKNVISDYREVPKKGWNKDSVFAFDFEIKNSETNYEIDLLLRNTDLFPSQNLWIEVEQIYENSSKKDTVNIFLMDQEGMWRGGGIGSSYDNNFIYKPNTNFNRTGQYSIKIRHLMRYDFLLGIERVGLDIFSKK